MNKSVRRTHLPLKQERPLTWNLSWLVGAWMGVLSLWGLIAPHSLYASPALVQSYMVNDAVNLLIGLPALALSLWLARRGSLIGLLFWPGGLLYVLYNYLAYVFGIPFQAFNLNFLALVLLSAALLVDLLRNIDHQDIQARLSGKVPVKLAGWLLIVFGVGFFLRAVGPVASALVDKTSLPVSEAGALVADLTLSLPWALGGLSLVRRRPFGFGSSLGFLYALALLFLGLILLLLLQPVMTTAPFDLGSLVVILVMSLVCFIPFGLFVRGVIQAETS